MIKIGLVGSYRFRQFVNHCMEHNSFPDIKIGYVGASYDSGVFDVLHTINKNKYDILVMGPNDFEALEEYLSTPVYVVKPGISDILSIHPFIEDYERTVFFFQTVHDMDLTLLENVLGIHIRKQIYQRDENVTPLLEKYQSQGVTSIVGVPRVTDTANLMGFRTFYYYSQRNLESAIYNAKQIAMNINSEREYIEVTTGILDHALCGAIRFSGADAKISFVNASALSMLHCRREDLLYHPVRNFVSRSDLEHFNTERPEENDLQFKFHGVDVIGNIFHLNTEPSKHQICLLFETASNIQHRESLIQQELKRKKFQNHYSFDDVIGKSSAIRRAVEQARRFARSNSTILINGETGSGKEVFAQSIHDSSPRRSFPFVAINCAALPDTLIESELFGYSPGAFTGASSKGKQGLIEQANHGTMFLDEIDSLTPGFQAKLLRVLQEKEIIRIGGSSPVPVDVRFIVATNHNLQKLVAQEQFRNDLYYRINVLHLTIPPLRDRKEDIPRLFAYHLRRYSPSLYDELAPVLEQLADTIKNYSFPGNIRELISIIERFSVLMDESRLNDFSYLSELLRDCLDINEDGSCTPQTKSEASSAAGEAGLSGAFKLSGNYKDDVADAERRILETYLDRHNGNMTQLAEQLGISRATLYNKLRRNGE